MEADDVVIEYLRGKLKQARGARAESVMKPPAAVPADDGGALGDDEAAELEGLISGSSDEATDDEACLKCGKPAAECQC